MAQACQTARWLRFGKGFLLNIFLSGLPFTSARSDWATDSQGRRYTVLDVWCHTSHHLSDELVERNRQLLLTVHMCNEDQFDNPARRRRSTIERVCQEVLRHGSCWSK